MAPATARGDDAMLQIITDSTSDIPADLREALGIQVVPLAVRFGNEVFQDGVDLTADEFYRRLRGASALPSTAAPSPGTFAERYRGAIDAGNQALSIHLSGRFSSTHDSAAMAAAEFGADQVQVVDTRTTSMALGLIVLRAAEAAKQGASLREVRALIDSLVPRAHVYLTMDSLENLRKGGRIGRASAFLGNLLNVKPLITVTEGEAAPVERVRTLGRALSRLVELVVAHARIERLAIGYTDVPSMADDVSEMLRAKLPGLDPIRFRCGSTIGTYVGAGGVGVVFLTGPS